MIEKPPQLGEQRERTCSAACGLKNKTCEQTFVKRSGFGSSTVGWECSFKRRYQEVMSWSDFKEQNSR